MTTLETVDTLNLELFPALPTKPTNQAQQQLNTLSGKNSKNAMANEESTVAKQPRASRPPQDQPSTGAANKKLMDPGPDIGKPVAETSTQKNATCSILDSNIRPVQAPQLSHHKLSDLLTVIQLQEI